MNASATVRARRALTTAWLVPAFLGALLLGPFEQPMTWPRARQIWVRSRLAAVLVLVMGILTGCASAPTRNGPPPDAISPLASIAVTFLAAAAAVVLAALGIRSGVKSFRRARRVHAAARDDVAEPTVPAPEPEQDTP